MWKLPRKLTLVGTLIVAILLLASCSPSTKDVSFSSPVLEDVDSNANGIPTVKEDVDSNTSSIPAVKKVVILDNPDFAIDENNVLIKYTGTGGNVVIPEGVASIGDKAFYYCKNLTNITIPDSVTRIGKEAFLIVIT